MYLALHTCCNENVGECPVLPMPSKKCSCVVPSTTTSLATWGVGCGKAGLARAACLTGTKTFGRSNVASTSCLS